MTTSQWHRQLGRNNPNTPSIKSRRTYDLLQVTSPDTLPQRYKKFVGAKATKLWAACVTD